MIGKLDLLLSSILGKSSRETPEGETQQGPHFTQLISFSLYLYMHGHLVKPKRPIQEKPTAQWKRLAATRSSGAGIRRRS